MRRILLAASAAAAVLVAVGLFTGTASAQLPDDSITVTAQEPAEVPHNGTGSLEATVAVGCAVLLDDPTADTVSVSATDANGTLTSDTQTFVIGPQACITGMGTVSSTVTLTLTPSPDAPGVVAIPLNVTASVAGREGSTEVQARVSYRAGTTVTPQVKFPLTVRNGSATFAVLVVFDANAPTMVMFEQERFTQGGGSVSGLADIIRPAGAEETLQVTYKAPPGAWNRSVYQFDTFSHWILQSSGQAGPFQNERTVEWAFVQGDGASGGEPDEDNESPGPAVVVLMGVLVGAAAAARRAGARRRQ